MEEAALLLPGNGRVKGMLLAQEFGGEGGSAGGFPLFGELKVSFLGQEGVAEIAVIQEHILLILVGKVGQLIADGDLGTENGNADHALQLQSSLKKSLLQL